MDLVLRDHHDLFWGETADSYESAIRGFWDGEITLNLSVILHFSQMGIFFSVDLVQNDWNGYF